ncbi:MAG: hypothetical protein GX455_11525 [Phycisphaerae bacterium]|nr:hypothetical protein [Phycisphaerae bacterium]
MEQKQDEAISEGDGASVKQRLFTLKILFFSIQAGLWTAFAVLLFMRMTSSVSKSLDPEVGRILWAVGVSITCFSVMTCVIIRRLSGRMMAACDDFGGALAKFFPAMMAGLAICEMAGLFQAISLLFSEEIAIPIVLFLINAIFMWWLFPGGRKLRRIHLHYRGK